jgi:hypothetical protein
MKQLRNYGHIMHISGGYLHVVYKPTDSIHANVALVAKALGVAFLGLVCIRVSLLLLFLYSTTFNIAVVDRKGTKREE